MSVWICSQQLQSAVMSRDVTWCHMMSRDRAHERNADYHNMTNWLCLEGNVWSLNSLQVCSDSPDRRLHLLHVVPSMFNVFQMIFWLIVCRSEHPEPVWIRLRSMKTSSAQKITSSRNTACQRRSCPSARCRTGKFCFQVLLVTNMEATTEQKLNSVQIHCLLLLQ